MVFHRLHDSRTDAMGRLTKPVRNTRQGFVFVLAIISLAVLLALGLLSLHAASSSLWQASRERDLTQALHTAEAVSDATEKYIRSLPAPLTSTTYFPLNGSYLTLNTGKGKAIIYCDNGNNGSWSKKYIIVSTGWCPAGDMQRTIILQLRQQSFSLFSYFTDFEQSSITNDPIWFWSRDQLSGPVHSNDQFHINWDKTSINPIFYDTVSSAQSSIAWAGGGTPSSMNDWSHIISAGQTALSLGVDRIELPATSDGQKNAAWGDTTGFPTSTSINLPTVSGQVKAGIYVTGDCQINMSVDTFGRQLVAITQGSTTKTITVDLQNNQTTVSGSSTTYTGVPNGVIYCSGNITSLKGTLADNYVQGSTVVRRNGWTIATDVASGKDMTITDNLQYKTQPDTSQPPTYINNLKAPVLGLVSEDIKLSNSCPNDMTVNGVMLAGGKNTTNGSFWFEGYNSGVIRNNLNLLGGVIQKRRGPVGMFDTSRNKATSGYTKNYRYDPRMADTPPPFFPLTGQYDLISWQCK